MRISDWSSDVCSSDLDDRDREHDHADEQADQPHRVDDRLAAIMLGRGAVLDEAEDDLACPDRALEHSGDREQEDDELIEHRRSEEHTSELQSLMRISYAVFCLKKKKKLN